MEYNSYHIIQVEYKVIDMLKHGILGLLNYKDMTGYEIMKTFNDSLNYFWTANTSQIYRELQTLKKDGFVTDVVIEQNGKPDKKVFSITENGRRELKHWLKDDDYGNNNSPLCMKVFFSGELSKQENIERFQKLKKDMQNTLEKYSAIYEIIKAYKDEISRPEDSVYWGMTVDYGICYMKMLIQWCDSCIKKLEDDNNEDSRY